MKKTVKCFIKSTVFGSSCGTDLGRTVFSISAADSCHLLHTRFSTLEKCACKFSITVKEFLQQSDKGLNENFCNNLKMSRFRGRRAGSVTEKPAGVHLTKKAYDLNEGTVKNVCV